MQEDVKIFEDQYQQKSNFQTQREDLMTKEQIKKTDFYLLKYDELSAEVEEKLEEWRKIEELYKGDREIFIEGTDQKAHVNIMLPTIEGQVASLIETNITANFKGKGISDQRFARTCNMIGDLILKENKIKRKMKRFGRRYILFGNAIFGYGWDDTAFDGMGLPEIRTPAPGKVLIDGNVKDLEDLQKAEYIIEEMGNKSILWARKEYGDEIADAIELGNNDPNFETEVNVDDSHTFTLIYVWTRNNEEGNLQRLEISKCGVLLRESDPSEPFYKHVHNKYPYSVAGLYPEEEEFYRFGDGQMLAPVQKLINKLYDEILTAIKFSSQSRTFVDPRAEVDPDEFDNDPSHPIMAKNPREFIHATPGGGINQIVYMLIQDLFRRVQEMTRFSTLMTGNNPQGGMTATQVAVQTQQGNAGINDKRKDISDAIGEAMLYSLALTMEFWTSATALRLTEEPEKFEWVDARQLSNIPVMVPTDRKFKDKFKKESPNAEVPEYMALESENEDGEFETVTKEIALDVDVSIGEGLPSNKIALYNIILSLAQIMLPDEMGQMKPLLTHSQVKDKLEEYLGFKLSEEEDPQQQMLMMMQQMGMMGQQQPGGPQQPQVPPMNQSPDIAGAGIGGMAKGGLPGV